MDHFKGLKKNHFSKNLAVAISAWETEAIRKRLINMVSHATHSIIYPSKNLEKEIF